MEKSFSALIPPQPEILLALNSELKSENPDQARIAQLLKSDVSLYSNILKTVNSPYYGLVTTVTSIELALRLLGLERIFSLVRLTILRNTLGKTGRMERFWDTAKDISTLSTQIAPKVSSVSQDDAFTLGMLHDCGIPLMVQAFPGYRDFLQGAGNLEPAEYERQEQELFGFSHYQVGARMAERWYLPQHITDAIKYQPRMQDVLEDRIDVDERTRHLLAVLALAQDVSTEYRYYWRIAPKQELSRLKPALHFLALVDLDFLELKDQLIEQIDGKSR